MLFIVATIHFQPETILLKSSQGAKFGRDHVTCIEGGVDGAKALSWFEPHFKDVGPVGVVSAWLGEILLDLRRIKVVMPGISFNWVIGTDPSCVVPSHIQQLNPKARSWSLTVKEIGSGGVPPVYFKPALIFTVRSPEPRKDFSSTWT